MLQDSVVIRDSTLREGLDVPGIDFSMGEKLRIVRWLRDLGIKEIEIGQPGRIAQSRPLNEKIKKFDGSLVTSGLVFGFGNFKKELEEAGFLDRIDILMPLLSRGPKGDKEIGALAMAINHARKLLYKDIGAGFPHATSADPGFLSEISRVAFENGARRIIVYDTNGKATPEEIVKIVTGLSGILPVHIHCHNDRGLALINSLAALEAGARFVDVTFGGIGDRAGNTALEPLIVNLELKGIKHNLNIKNLKNASDTVAEITKLRSPLFPVTGDFSFYHSTKTHLEKPQLFEAFPPQLIGARRKVISAQKIINKAQSDFLDMIRKRRSIRDFNLRPIERSILRTLIKSAFFAPSSMGGQPWHLILVEDKEIIRKIIRIKNAKCPFEKSGYLADFLLKAPLLMVVCVDKGRSFGREIENGVLAAANIMLAAAACGLGTTYMAAFRSNDPSMEKEIKRLLKLPRGIMPVSILPLGYPAARPGRKKTVEMTSRVHGNIYKGPAAQLL